MRNICKVWVLVFAMLSSAMALADVRSDQQKYELHNHALKQSNAIGRIDSGLICGLFAQKKFAQLEEVLHNAERAFKADAAYEFNFVRSYEAIPQCQKVSVSEMKQALDEWVSGMNSASAFESRGYFYNTQAWKSRGTRYIGETNKADLEIATQYWDLAKKDFLRSIELNAELLPAYQGLIGVYSATSDADGAVYTSQQAIKRIPTTYYVRQSALQYLQPKWGKSYEDAERLISEAQEHAEKNNRLWGLRGYVEASKGYQCILDKDFPCAVARYSTAIQSGDKFSWLGHLAYSYYAMGMYQEAANSIKRVLTYQPNNGYADWLANVLEGPKQQANMLVWNNFNRDW